MVRPASKPVMVKAPRKEHPYAPGEPVAQDNPATTDHIITLPKTATLRAATVEKVFSTRLPADLVRRITTHAAAKDVPVQTSVAAALERYLADSDGR